MVEFLKKKNKINSTGKDPLIDFLCPKWLMSKVLALLSTNCTICCTEGYPKHCVWKWYKMSHIRTKPVCLFRARIKACAENVIKIIARFFERASLQKGPKCRDKRGSLRSLKWDIFLVVLKQCAPNDPIFGSLTALFLLKVALRKEKRRLPV